MGKGPIHIEDSGDEEPPTKPTKAAPDEDDTQLYRLDTGAFENVLVSAAQTEKFSPAPVRRLRSKQNLHGSTTRCLQALPAPEDLQTPSPKPAEPAPVTPPKQPITREDQLALKASKGQNAIFAERPGDWTDAKEEEMWNDYALFLADRDKEREVEVAATAEEPRKKRPRAQQADGRPKIFARRYCPSTECRGKVIWEGLCDSFMAYVLPHVEDGSQTKHEETLQHLFEEQL